MPDHAARDAAHQGAPQGAEPAAPEDHKPRARLLGDPDYLGVRATGPSVDARDLAAHTLYLPHLLVETLAGVLLGALAQPTLEFRVHDLGLRDGEEARLLRHVDDVQLRAERPRQPDRRAGGSLGLRGPVRRQKNLRQ